MRFWKRPSHAEKVEKARILLAEAGLRENPDALFLLLSEVRSLNGRVAWMIGALSIIVVLFVTHVWTQFG